MSWWFRCPQCKGVGQIDEEQRQSIVLIVCGCGFHDYAEHGTVLTGEGADGQSVG